MQSNEQEKEQKLIQNKLKKLMIPFMLILMLVLGISFAVLNYSYQGKKKVVLTASTLNLTLDETKTLSDILVENSIPISDKEGLKQEKYSFSLVNKGPEAVDYTIYIVEDKEENHLSFGFLQKFCVELELLLIF